MDKSECLSLDIEFKRYLQIIKPYLGHLSDENVLNLCRAWVNRLSKSTDNEKSLRNKYILNLCYQLSRGVLDHPFSTLPTKDGLEPIVDDFESDTSSEVESLMINEEDKTSEFIAKTELNVESDLENSFNIDSNTENTFHYKRSNDNNHLQTVLCYTCPEITKNQQIDHHYESRAKNLIVKLREIKNQNILLNHKLVSMKKESNTNINNQNEDYNCTADVNLCNNMSSTTIKLLQNQVLNVNESRNILHEKISDLQDKLIHLNEQKNQEITELKSKHELEIKNIQNCVTADIKNTYDKKIDELKMYYEDKLKNLVPKNVFEEKDVSIKQLTEEIKDQKEKLQYFIDSLKNNKPNINVDVDLLNKTTLLERRLIKSERSRIKCIKVYEAKLAKLQRDKHLTECSLQLQMAKQRAEVVTEMTDENQLDLNTALGKLEDKYKNIVANVQATAIQRRLKDQKILESLLHSSRNECFINSSRKATKTARSNDLNDTLSEAEFANLFHGRKFENYFVDANKSSGEDSLTAGYNLNGERLGVFIDRVHIPQKDINSGPNQNKL